MTTAFRSSRRRWLPILVIVLAAADASAQTVRQQPTAASPRVVAADDRPKTSTLDGAATFVLANTASTTREFWLPIGDLAATPGTGLDVQPCPDDPKTKCARWIVPAESELTADLGFLQAAVPRTVSFQIRSTTGGAATTVSVEIPAADLVITDKGFAYPPAEPGQPPRMAAAPAVPVHQPWKKAGDKEKKESAPLITIANRTTAARDVQFKVDSVDPATARAQVDAWKEAGLVLTRPPGRCPDEKPACIATFAVPPAGVRIPARLLDKTSSAAIAELTLPEASLEAPVAHVVLEPEEAAAVSTRDRFPTRVFDGGKQGGVVPLDNTGVGDWDYLNPRKVPRIDKYEVFGFENRTADRTFVVAIPVNDTMGTRTGRRVMEDAGVKSQPCKHTTGTCVLLTLSPGTSKAIPTSWLTDAKRPVVAFNVRFFDEADTPAYPTGYARTSDAAYEAESRTTWSVLGRIFGTTEPDLKTDAGGDVRITADTPFDGGRRVSTMSGVGRLSVKQNLGDRASADVDLQFEQGTFGGNDSRVVKDLKSDVNPVTVPKYQFTAFGINGLQLTFGKFTFVENALISEAGEGFRFNWRNLGFSRILKRESKNRVPQRDNDDHDVWIAQANNLLSNIGGSKSLRAVNLTAIYGRDRNPAPDPVAEPDRIDTERTYWTAGAEVTFAVPSIHVQGSGAVFHSRRDPRRDTPANRPGNGTMGVITLTRSMLSASTDTNPGTLQRSFGVTIAQGRSDRADTRLFDEGYLGDSHKYGPDMLFMSSLATRLGPAPTKDNPIAVVPGGLSNTGYFQAFYNEETFSPLELISALVGVQKDVISKRTTIRYHRYRFPTQVLDVHHPGDEIDMEFSIETPRGISSSLSFGRFLSGPGYDHLFPNKEPWKIVAFVQVKM